MRAPKATRLVVVATMAVMGVAGPVAAQTRLFGLNVEGETEVGTRFYADRPSPSTRGKLEEYRDLPQGPFLERFQLRLFSPDEDYSFEFGGSKWGQQDQDFSLRSGRLGLWEFGFDWDQMRHVYSTNARMLATETKRGLFTLPSDLTRAIPGDGPRYNSAREIEVSTRWDTAKLSFRLTPTPDLELKASYDRIKKDGDRPMGVPFGFSFIEVLEPIEQTIHDFRLGATIARDQWQLQFGYTGSIFQNAVDSLSADNPFRANDTTAAASRGTMSLPPDNMAHTLSVAGGVNLPWWRTRLTSNVSYGARLQHQEFLPHTRNPRISSNDTELPQGSLNGNVQTFLVNLAATSRPLPPLTLSAKYRFYDLNDWSDVVHFNNWVETDSTLRTTSKRAGRWSYERHNADLDGRWQVLRPLALTLGVGWERWDRSEHREVNLSDEASAKAALDLTPFEWVLVRLKYVPSIRRNDHYFTKAHEEHTTQEEDTTPTAGQSPLLRKFDEGERNRHRVDLLVQLMPTETITISPTAGYRNDDYYQSRLGLQNEISWSAGMDAAWTPLERVSFTTGYMHEVIFQKQRSRFRTSTLDVPALDWISVNTDTVDTFHAGVKATLLPKVLDLTLGGNYSTALGRVETRNPGNITTQTAANQDSARAKPWPAFEDNQLRLETALKYYFWKNWTAKLGYVWESFDKQDWRTDTLNPFVSGVTTGIWLGADQKNYDAHIVGASLSYQFK